VRNQRKRSRVQFTATLIGVICHTTTVYGGIHPLASLSRAEVSTASSRERRKEAQTAQDFWFSTGAGIKLFNLLDANASARRILAGVNILGRV